jgi:FkbM family methyltransferase
MSDYLEKNNISKSKQYFHELLNDKFYSDVIFKNKSTGYYVEIGALDGFTHSQSVHFEKLKNWDGIIVEPSPQWLPELTKNRKCNICTNPISDVRETNKFVVRSFLAYSHLIDIEEEYGPSDVIETIDVETITMTDLFDKYNTPTEIDWVAIDTEGYELRILTKYFEENEKYKINLISFEHAYEEFVIDFFKDKPYVKIHNPYLNFIKLDFELGMVRLSSDNNFYNAAGQMYVGSITDLKNITFEHYYVHLDYLKDNPNLKYYLNSNTVRESQFIK